jgi:predicted nucleic acid-binding protein
MSDRYFVDTSILVYANDRSEKRKHQIAKNLILDGMKNECAVISAQVLSEFYVTITQKVKETVTHEVAFQEIRLLRFIEIVTIDFDLIIKAFDITQKNKLSYWDSLILAAAITSGVGILYSEDLNHGQLIDNVKIVNPFI